MPLFFAFSDESGKYKKERSEKFISKNPYYCRATVLLEAGEWRRLRENFDRLKKDMLGIDRRIEVKWSYIWSLYKHFQKGERVPAHKPYFSLRHHSLDTLVEFIRHVLQDLAECPSSRISLTVTFNEQERTKAVESAEIVALHLRHSLDTVEKEMKNLGGSLCVLFFNPEEPRMEKQLRKAFMEISGRDFPRQYPHLKDSYNFELSPQSFGSHLADFCAGVFNGCLRLYPQSIDLFRHQIWPIIMNKKNRVLGYGISEIPKNQKNRAFLKKTLKRIFDARDRDYRVSLEERLRSKGRD